MIINVTIYLISNVNIKVIFNVDMKVIFNVNMNVILNFCMKLIFNISEYVHHCGVPTPSLLRSTLWNMTQSLFS